MKITHNPGNCADQAVFNLRLGNGIRKSEQTDYPQNIWVPEYTEHDGYGESGMLKNPSPTP